MPGKSAHKRSVHSSKLLTLFILTALCIPIFILTFIWQTRTNNPICANSISCIKDLSGNFISDRNGIFLGKNVISPDFIAYDYDVEKRVLGETTDDNKRIEVDLTTQHVTAFEGTNAVFDFPVSTGKWSHTPTGEFRIWIKLRYTKMEGGVPGTGTYYNLPNVPFTMYFYNDSIPKYRGYGLHGAYWHNNFGHPMSHGCVNISIENAEKLYNWANPVSEKGVTYASDENPGTKVLIFGTTPSE